MIGVALVSALIYWATTVSELFWYKLRWNIAGILLVVFIVATIITLLNGGSIDLRGTGADYD